MVVCFFEQMQDTFMHHSMQTIISYEINIVLFFALEKISVECFHCHHYFSQWNHLLYSVSVSVVKYSRDLREREQQNSREWEQDSDRVMFLYSLNYVCALVWNHHKILTYMWQEKERWCFLCNCTDIVVSLRYIMAYKVAEKDGSFLDQGSFFILSKTHLSLRRCCKPPCALHWFAKSLCIQTFCKSIQHKLLAYCVVWLDSAVDYANTPLWVKKACLFIDGHLWLYSDEITFLIRKKSF